MTGTRYVSPFDEFQRRGIDVSAIYDGKSITFASPVRYDLPDNKLIAIE